VNIVAKDIISIVTAVSRIRGQSLELPSATSTASSAEGEGTLVASSAVAAATTDDTEGDEKNQSYYKIISKDSDILRIVVQVMNGMSSTATELQKYLGYWDKYRTLWELDKDSFIKKYAKTNRSPSQFDIDINRYKQQQSDILSETSNHNINFVRVDSNVLKEALVGHCTVCQVKLTNLLNSNGHTELQDIFALFKNSRENLTVAPINLDELSAKIGVCRELKEKLGDTKGRFDPVREIYKTLSKFEVAVHEDEITMLESLDQAYEDFTYMVSDSEKMLDKSKVTMKRDLESQQEVYNNQIAEMKIQSTIDLPYSHEDKDPNDALAMIEVYKGKIAKAKEREATLSVGFNIFAIPNPEHKDLSALIRDIDYLSQIWQISIEWSEYWGVWKVGQFNDLNVEEMEGVVGNYSKKVGKLGRDIKRWKVWESMKAELDRFRDTIPLIQDLRNQAMRPRHWASLQERVGTEFDPQSLEFTLDRVMKLGFVNHAEFIGELSGNANKELAIEVSLADLERRWAAVEMDVRP